MARQPHGGPACAQPAPWHAARRYVPARAGGSAEVHATPSPRATAGAVGGHRQRARRPGWRCGHWRPCAPVVGGGRRRGRGRWRVRCRRVPGRAARRRVHGRRHPWHLARTAQWRRAADGVEHARRGAAAHRSVQPGGGPRHRTLAAAAPGRPVQRCRGVGGKECLRRQQRHAPQCRAGRTRRPDAPHRDHGHGGGHAVALGCSGGRSRRTLDRRRQRRQDRAGRCRRHAAWPRRLAGVACRRPGCRAAPGASSRRGLSHRRAIAGAVAAPRRGGCGPHPGDGVRRRHANSMAAGRALPGASGAGAGPGRPGAVQPVAGVRRRLRRAPPCWRAGTALHSTPLLCS
jgi:hypothetical protein